jgi:hypothetical protein
MTPKRRARPMSFYRSVASWKRSGIPRRLPHGGAEYKDHDNFRLTGTARFVNSGYEVSLLGGKIYDG